MTYVVTENCIRCKYMDCVEVCPVDCFYVGENMLVDQPRRMHRLRGVRAGMPGRGHRSRQRRPRRRLAEANRTYAALWPNITRKGEPPADADAWKDKPDKAALFSPEPGTP